MESVFYPEPFTVEKVSGPIITVESERGRVFRRNVSFLRPYLLQVFILLQVHMRNHLINSQHSAIDQALDVARLPTCRAMISKTVET